MPRSFAHLALHLRGPSLRFLIILLVSLAPGTVSAQRYRFKYYSHADGLKDSETHCLLQDHTGFLWVGTAAGLYRYDGAQFVGFHADDPSGDFIEALGETPDGTLWVGTMNGLARVRNGRLQFIDSPGRLRVNGQSGLATDSQGRLYAATSGGLYIGEPGSQDYQFRLHATPEQIADRAAYSVHIDPAGVDSWCGPEERSLLSRLPTVWRAPRYPPLSTWIGPGVFSCPRNRG